jgi:ribosomal protein L40E
MYYCEKCGATWDEPFMPMSLVQEVVALRRSDRPLAATQRLQSVCPNLKDAKAIAMHITLEPGKCHRCSADLTVARSCSKCGSFNYDW